MLRMVLMNGGVIETEDGTDIISVSSSGVVTMAFSALTLTGNTVIGDASGDTLTVNATSTFLAPITVGVDDAGHDVKLFGATSGKSWLWDESADKMIVTGDTQLTGALTVGVDGTGHDVIFYGDTASANVTWDESADDLIFNGAAALVLGTGGASTGTANTLVPIVFTAATEIIAAAAGGAISVATYVTHVSADAGGDAFTIASGTVVGQRKRIYFLATAGGTGVVTGAFRGADNTLTFTNAGEYAELIWDGTDWLDIELGSTDDTSIATPPVLSTV